MTHEQLMSVMPVLMICLFVFVLIREVICFYFKINKRVELQEKSIINQQKIIELLSKSTIDI